MESTKQQIPDMQVRRKPMRLWAGIIILILQWLIWFAMPLVMPETLVIGVFGGLAGWLAIVIWWGFFSRAPVMERWLAPLLMIGATAGTFYILHESIATGGQGLMFYMFSLPVLSLTFVAWAVVTQRLPNGIRRWTMVATILISCGIWGLFRNDGITGEFSLDLVWRWAMTSEERLLSQGEEKLPAIVADSTRSDSIVEWPGFRGANRDGIIHGVLIETDWSTTPPEEIWRRYVGPGCSSFAVDGDLLYTQEQRGEEEVVSCYDLNTGEPIWRHSDPARFWDSHAGAGPRGTPAISNGRIYTFGATGIVNALDARDGSLIWSRNAAADTDTKDSGWGFSSSPLVVGDVVMIAATGTLIAYDIHSGEIRWKGPDGGDSYSSPHLFVIDGVAQVLLLSGAGITSFDLASGGILWKLPWVCESHIIQPALISGNELLVSAGDLNGIGRISVNRDEEGWKPDKIWTSEELKPNFNDMVIHNNHVYGFNNPYLVSIDLTNGSRNWRGGRYGGQLLLLADQDLLLVLTEKGKLVLVEANPDQFNEIATFPAIEGKTWNHPVLVGDILVVRNTEEMAAFRLPLRHE